MTGKSSLFLACIFAVSVLASCGTATEQGVTNGGTNQNSEEQNDTEESNDNQDDTVENEADHDDAGDYRWDGTRAVHIEMNGNTVAADSAGVKVEGGAVTISSAGAYIFHGTLTNGRIIVDTTDEGVVQLILNGVDISCANSAPNRASARS